MTELAEQLLELAAKGGAEAAEVFQARLYSRPIFFESNRLKQLESIQSEGIALRLWRNGRPGLAVAYGPVETTALVERAMSISNLNEPEYIELVSKAKNRHYPSQGIYVPIEQLIKWGKEAIALIREFYPDVICNGEWDYEIESTRLINSLGLDCNHIDTTLSGYVEANWVRGDDLLNISDGQIQRNSLDPKKVANRILQRLNWAHKNVTSPSGRLPILFTAKAADLLWNTISGALNGKQVLEGASPWSKHLGKLVTNQQITISQQPDKGPFSCPFDDEGTPTRSIEFIQKGVLQLFYTDTTTGRLLGSGTTGNGFRPDLGRYPTPELFNFIVKPGKRSLHELIGMLDDGIIVDQILGSGAGISGEFSISVELGYRVRKGEIVGRVKNTMITGNVYTALKQLVELGNDGEWNGSCYTPHVIVEGLSTISKVD
ncbi:MAG: TldD/PmbA family protein [Trichodesmium sp. St16_bin4-tuft]|uniref:Peptidase U62, modulator of DNA gyrase n=1 Tax=Trichodesmium erythraeum (strain IMS101) TaxID=203124 RepID=Q10VN6_TRIEI|nr:TldD/PmbA family protein [Trichodesmium erythraeum GBRTRLIN201]MCH2048177.1 TldD/PmbA family protein [Trichodesmium sp. ALOHA_ZT_67]MDE5100827.1 TldD/PmbA family protein [Trichodesmium sp. St16_bin4-tuft]MDT9339448.1 TldD/PmbA family protein [Trichodesmium erythraeum 21-75]